MISRMIALGAGILLVTGLLFASYGSAAPSAQEATAEPESPTVVPTPTPGFNALLVAQANLATVPVAPALLRVVTLTIPAGVVTEPTSNDGPVLILVQNGSILLTADEALVGPPAPADGLLQPITPTPSEAQDVIVAKGFQALISPGSTIVMENAGGSPATVLMILLEPVSVGSGTPVPSQ